MFLQIKTKQQVVTFDWEFVSETVISRSHHSFPNTPINIFPSGFLFGSGIAKEEQLETQADIVSTWEELLVLPGCMHPSVNSAINAVKRILPDYWKSTLLQRVDGPTTCGSFYPGVSDPEDLELIIRHQDWILADNVPNLMDGCVAYVAALPGQGGIVYLKDLPGDSIVTLDDRKNTGKISATVKRGPGIQGENVVHTTLIIGKEADEDVVFTFHPGDPVVASKVEATTGLHGKTISVSEALGLGLETAKIV